MDNVRIRDDNNRSFHVDATINLVVKIGSKVEKIRFNVFDRLATRVILRCDYCDKNINSIRPRAEDAIPLPKQKENESARRRVNEKVIVLAKQYYNLSQKQGYSIIKKIWSHNYRTSRRYLPQTSMPNRCRYSSRQSRSAIQGITSQLHKTSFEARRPTSRFYRRQSPIHFYEIKH